MQSKNIHAGLLSLALAIMASFGQCSFFFKNSQDQVIPRLHPGDTHEIQSCLSPDLEQEEKTQCRFYAAVIDAGSTGTRLHLLEFSHDINQENSPFHLETETYKEIKPGLSSFSRSPELAAENIRELLLVAKKIVPEELWEHTPITMKATAGLRLLPEEDADVILSHVEGEVLQSDLLLHDDAVGILSGIDEGVFGWFTLNFLLGRLDGVLNKKIKAAAALDLGGGSTQITFVPFDFNVALQGLARQKYSHRLKIFEKDVRLYTHSYLGNGLIASRLGIAKLSTPEWAPGSPPTLRTHCLSKKFIMDDWDYAGNIWLISAHQDAGFENCMEVVKQYVWNVTNIKPAPELENHDVYAFAYYHDRALQANLINYTLELAGGSVNVGDYKMAAERACEMPAEAIGPENWMPWQCLDLCYIYTLLHHGYGLPDNKTINLVKKLHQMEVSWALGAGFHLLNSFHDSLKKTKREMLEKELEAVLARERAEIEQKRQAEQKIPIVTQYMEPAPVDNSMENRDKKSLYQHIVRYGKRLYEYLSGAVTHLLMFFRLLS